MTVKNFAMAIINLCLAVTLSASHLCQPTPTSKEVIRLAEKAMGGVNYYVLKPYTVDFSINGNDSYDGMKTIDKKCSYKETMYHEDATVLLKRLAKPFNSKIITYMDKNETWESLRNKAYKKSRDVTLPMFPRFNQGFFNGLIFDPVMPSVVKKDGKDFYRLDAIHGRYHMIFWIDMNTSLIYTYEVVDTKGSYKRIEKYMNYVKIQNIMIPEKMIIETTENNGAKSVYEHTARNFTFKNDIPDSLFELPKR